MSAILTPEDHIISDELNHASIIDGCRLSKAKIHVFPHKDVARRGNILADLEGAPGRKLLISDGVFSMDGDIGPLPGLVEAAERHGAIMMVDDAHSSGVLGRNGRGTIDHFGLHGRVQIQVGTLSKAIGVLGGYVCGTPGPHRVPVPSCAAVPLLHSHPPAVAAACLAAFDVLEQEPERIQQLWENTKYFKQGLRGRVQHRHQRDADHAGDRRRSSEAHQLSRELFNEGVLATGIGFPTVQRQGARAHDRVVGAHQGGTGPCAGGIPQGRETHGAGVIEPALSARRPSPRSARTG